MTTIDLYFDGASKGNPGESSYGFVIIHSEQEITGSGYIGKHTNNEAEYTGLIEALNKVDLLSLSINIINIHGDSKLVIEQMAGNWKINADHLRKLRNKAHDILTKLKAKNENLKINYKHIARNLNSKADKLASEAFTTM
jgi:ribonuclease HI